MFGAVVCCGVLCCTSLLVSHCVVQCCAVPYRTAAATPRCQAILLANSASDARMLGALTLTPCPCMSYPSCWWHSYASCKSSKSTYLKFPRFLCSVFHCEAHSCATATLPKPKTLNLNHAPAEKSPLWQHQVLTTICAAASHRCWTQAAHQTRAQTHSSALKRAFLPCACEEGCRRQHVSVHFSQSMHICRCGLCCCHFRVAQGSKQSTLHGV